MLNNFRNIVFVKSIINFWNNLSLVKKGYLVLIIPSCALLLSAWMFYSSLSIYVDARNQTNHVINSIDILSKLNEELYSAAGAAYAKFTLNEKNSINRFENSKFKIISNLKKLKAIVYSQHSVKQQKDFIDLENLIHIRLNTLDMMLEFDDPINELPDIVSEGRNAVLIALKKFSEIRKEDEDILEQKMNALEQYRLKLELSVLTSVLFGFLGGIIAMYIFTTSSIKRIKKIEDKVRLINPDHKYLDYKTSDEISRLELIYDDAVEKINDYASKLKDMKEKAVLESKSKSMFVAQMSHEIRTPLTGITGMLQLAEISDSKEEIKGYLKYAMESSLQLSRLLSDILDLSHVESGKLSLVMAPFNLIDSINKVKTTFDQVASNKGLYLDLKIADHINKDYFSDSTRFQQILSNLVGNSIKFTEKGGITIEANIVESLTSADRILFSVSDTGIGMNDKQTKKLFEPFVQGEHSSERNHMGAGLGLSIVKQLITMLGGNMSIVSEPDKGTKIFFTLMFEISNRPSEVELTTLGNAQKVLVKNELSKLKILLAEDDRATQIFTKKILEIAGHSVTVVDNGAIAFDTIQEEHFDLLLTDIQMPVMDGYELIRRIRNGDTGADNVNIPIMAMTGRTSESDRQEFLKAGVTCCVVKPIDKLDIEEKVMKIFKSQI